MKRFKKTFLGLVATAAFVALGALAPSTAFAQFGGSCTVDADCGSNYECVSGQCQPCISGPGGACASSCTFDSDCPSGQICSDSNLCVDEPDTCEFSYWYESMIIVPSSLGISVGDVVQPVASARNTSTSSHCSYEASCTTSYQSNFNINAACGNGLQCTFDIKGPGTPALKHSKYLGTGKYEVIEYLGLCNSTGDKIFKIKGCNC